MTTLNAANVAALARDITDFDGLLDIMRDAWRARRAEGDTAKMAAITTFAAELKAARDVKEEDLDAEYRSFTQVERRQEAKAFWSDPDFRDAAPPAEVANARYTVVFDAATDDRITVRVREGFVGDDGKRTPQTVSVLYGPDNGKDYVGVGFWKNGELKVWGKQKGTARAARAEAAMRVIAKDPRAAMEAYAVRSSKCAMCGRDLTVPASIYAGVGPECAKRLEG